MIDRWADRQEGVGLYINLVERCLYFCLRIVHIFLSSAVLLSSPTNSCCEKKNKPLALRCLNCTFNPAIYFVPDLITHEQNWFSNEFPSLLSSSLCVLTA